MTESPCLSRFACDRLLRGELLDAASARAHAAGCRRCGDRIAEHVRERAAFAVPLRWPRRRVWTGLVVTATAAATLLLCFALAPPRGEREKGKPSIRFYVQHAGAARRGGLGEIVAPGDALDFIVSTERDAYLAVVSVDAARSVSVYYPGAAMAAPIAAGRDGLLPTGVVLDGVLGPERIFAVFCDRPFTVEAAKAFVAGGAAAPGDCVVDATRIEKR